LKTTRLELASNYIENIKEWAYKDVVHIQNSVLSKNPYTSNFINKCILDREERDLHYFFIIKSILIYYTRVTLVFINYCVSFLIYRLFNNNSKFRFDSDVYLIDIFLLVDKIIIKRKFHDEYLGEVYKVLKDSDKNIVFLPRFYGLNRNPFKVHKLLQILDSNKKHNFLFEYELLKVSDLVKIWVFIIKYPFKQFELLQPHKSKMDAHFNYELFNSLKSTSFESYVRYLVGKRVAKILPSSSKIVSWQEFQNLEKAFYKAIRESDNNIFIFGCEFLVKYKTYISMHITDIDVKREITPHLTLTNGSYNYSKSDKHLFKIGVSSRYKEIFSHKYSDQEGERPLVLLSFNLKESVNLLNQIGHIENINIKIHPATTSSHFFPYVKKTWNFAKEDIYAEFKKTNLVFVAPMSGSALEAVACGLSVIIIASKDTVVANPLIEYGKGKIWDIAYDQNDVVLAYSSLKIYRKNNKEEVRGISKWYRENFFIEPNRVNIAKAFNLKGV
jgi:hypothetical protein